MTLEGEEIEFSDGFADLHTRSYEHILKGDGFSVADALPSIQIAHAIRHQTPVGLTSDYHPFAKLKPTGHPFARD